MASIPSPIRKWIRRYITGEGSSEIANQSPVQSVNSQTGDVTISVPVDSVNGQTGEVTLSAVDVNALADTYTAPVQSVNGDVGDITISVPVDQVNGQTGDVTLTASDVNALADTYSAPVQSVNSQTGDVTISVPVDSVNGQTGEVTLSAADVNALADTYTAPVQSVNGETGDVTVSGSSGAVISETVADYSSLPTPAPEREFYYVSNRNDVVIPSDLDLETWSSVFDGTIVAIPLPDSVVSRDPDDSQGNSAADEGLEIQVSQDWPEIEVEISSNSDSNADENLVVERVGDGAIVSNTDISDTTAGDVVTAENANLTAGTSYFIYSTSSNSRLQGFNGQPSFPYTSPDGNLSITGGYQDGPTTSFALRFSTIGNITG
jgi:predicted metal-dependent enzyme (double-stranded beta helix superfamily)